MRLIDADAILCKMESVMDMQDVYLPVHFMEMVIDDMPTIAANIVPKLGRNTVKGEIKMSENKREEILTKAKPILFNTEMVKAILDGRKTQTRRVALPNNDLREFKSAKYPTGWWLKGRVYDNWGDLMYDLQRKKSCKYHIGDILYVREAFAETCDCCGTTGIDCGECHCGRKYLYRASPDDFFDPIWKPSIHMPKEAARIFLRVTGVRLERLQDMTEEDAYEEGWSKPWCAHKVFENYPDSPIPCEAAGNPSCPIDPPCNHSVPELFGADIWDTTIKKSDLEKYGWDANPWVWVIEFERID